MRFYVKKVFIFLFFSVLFLCFIEVGLRITGYFYLSKIYVNNFKSAKYNFNIVCLGESTTGGLWVDWKDSYPMQLEKKLREFYNNQNICVIVPPHVGQNTSQMSKRIRHYINLYNPQLIILMAGINNGWSLSESNVVKFLNTTDKESLKIKFLVILNTINLVLGD